MFKNKLQSINNSKKYTLTIHTYNTIPTITYLQYIMYNTLSTVYMYGFMYMGTNKPKRNKLA